MITKRFLLFIFVFFAAFVILIARLAEFQIKNHGTLLRESIHLTEKVEIKKPLRGELYDRNNILIASSIQLYRLFFDKSMADEKDYDSLLNTVCSMTKKPISYYLRMVSDSKSKIVYLENDIEAEIYSNLKKEFQSRRISCFGFEEYQQRIYPREGIAAHIIGYVRKDSDGIDGIEKFYNEYLKGKEGIIYYRKDAAGRFQGRIKSKGFDVQNGNNLQLTLDFEIQTIVEEELIRAVQESKAAYGIGIVINPNTGEILALSNYPSFNPSRYYEYSEEIRKNKAIATVYDPGSTFKAVTLATALELNKIKIDSVLNAENGVFKLPNGKLIRDDHKFTFLTPKEAFVYSSNIVMAKISSVIGMENFYRYAYNFGFGNYTGIDLPGEVRGFITKPRKGDYSLYWMAHGYSVSVTPIQLISMYAAVINGGYLVKPFIVKKIFDSNGNVILENDKTIIRKVISEKTSRIMREIMRQVILEGTGKKAKLDFISCGGKTGTAKKFIQGYGYSSENYISSFIGFFPIDYPEYLVLIKIDSPKNGFYGGEIAAPVFKRIGDRIWEMRKKIHENRTFYTKLEEAESKNQFPDLTGKSRISAIQIARSFGSKIELIGDGKLVHNQIYDPIRNKVILILTKKSDTISTGKKVYVPNVVGLSLREASTKLKSSGIRFVVDGTGYVINQSVQPGEYINHSTVVKLICRREI